MRKNKNDTKNEWIDPDDAPELTDEWFDKADLYHGDTLIRRGRGRPKKAVVKETLNMRIDADVLAALRSLGKGWQTQVNAVLKEWVRNNV